MEALPELGDLFGRERQDDTLGLFEPEPGAHDATLASVTESRSSLVRTPYLAGACGQRVSGVKTIARAQYGQTMIDSLRSGLWLLLELVTDIIEQSGFIHLEQGTGGMLLPPTCEVQKVISKSTKRTEGALANALGVQEIIGPGDFLPLLVDQAIGTGVGRDIGPMEERQFHT